MINAVDHVQGHLSLPAVQLAIFASDTTLTEKVCKPWHRPLTEVHFAEPNFDRAIFARNVFNISNMTIRRKASTTKDSDVTISNVSLVVIRRPVLGKAHAEISTGPAFYIGHTLALQWTRPISAFASAILLVAIVHKIKIM